MGTFQNFVHLKCDSFCRTTHVFILKEVDICSGYTQYKFHHSMSFSHRRIYFLISPCNTQYFLEW